MERKVRFEYKHPEDMPVVYANGLYGGRGNTGEIIINIYQETPKPLESEVYRLNESNQLGPRECASPDGFTFERRVVGRFALTEQAARQIHVWLGNQLGAVRSEQKESDDGFRIIG